MAITKNLGRTEKHTTIKNSYKKKIEKPKQQKQKNVLAAKKY